MGTESGVSIEAAIADVKQVVARGIAYFEANAESEVRVDMWTPRETLCHFIAWHRYAAEGMESAAAGGDPTRIYASVDEMNARAVGRKSGWTVARLVEEMEELQTRLTAAARAAGDSDAPALVMPDGNAMNAAATLTAIHKDWEGHMNAMAAADAEAAKAAPASV